MQHNRVTVFILSGSQALMMIGNSLIIATSALVGYTLAENKSLATLPVALQFLSTMLLTIPASMLMKRHGRRYGFLLGSGLGFVGALIAVYAIWIHSFNFFVLGCVLVGAFNGFAVFYRFAAVDNAPEEFQSRAISLVLAGGVIAAFVGPNLARYTHDLVHDFPFMASYASLLAIYAMSFAILSFLRIPPVQESYYGQTARSLKQIAAQPNFIIALVCGMFGYGIMSFIMSATPLAMKVSEFSFGDTAWVIQWHVFGMFAPSFFTGYLIDRFGLANILMTGALLTGASIWVNLSGLQLHFFWIGLFLLGVGWNFLFIGATRLLTYCYKDTEKAKVQGINDLVVFSTVSFAALSAGPAQNLFGWEKLNELAIIPLGLIFISLLWLYRTSSIVEENPALETGEP